VDLKKLKEYNEIQTELFKMYDLYKSTNFTEICEICAKYRYANNAEYFINMVTEELQKKEII